MSALFIDRQGFLAGPLIILDGNLNVNRRTQLLKSKKGNLEVTPLQADDAESGRLVALKSKDGTLAVSDVTLPVAFVTSILPGIAFGPWTLDHGIILGFTSYHPGTARSFPLR